MSVIVEDHYKQLFTKQHFKNKRILIMTKSQMRKNSLTIGSTLALLLSFFVKHPRFTGNKIYLQGFSFDSKSGYDWNRQVTALKKVILLAQKYKKELIFTTKNYKIKTIIPKEPYKEDILFYVTDNGMNIPVNSISEMDIEIVKLLHSNIKEYTVEEIEEIIIKQFKINNTNE